MQHVTATTLRLQTVQCVDAHPAAAAEQLPEPTGERTSSPESTGKPEEHRELHTEPAATADSTHSRCWDTLHNKTNALSCWVTL